MRRQSICILLALMTVLVAFISLPTPTAQAAYTVLDDRNSAITFSPLANWTRGNTDCRSFQCTFTHSKVTNSTISYTFTDDNVSLVFSKGWNRGKAEVKINGLVVDTIDQYAPGCCLWQVYKRYNFTSSATRTITIRVLGTHSPGSTDNTIDLDAIVIDYPYASWGEYDDSAGSYNHLAPNLWVTGTDPNFYNGSNKHSDHDDNAVNFTFYGNEVDYYFTKGNRRGLLRVTIDGIDKGIIDQYMATCCIWNDHFEFKGLGNWVHTMNISVLGTHSSGSYNYIDVDKFHVRDCPNVSPAYSCRAYAAARRDRVHDYTSVEGDIGYNNPTIRDNGITADVLWLVGKDTIEIGWWKDCTNNNNAPFTYYGFYTGIDPITGKKRFIWRNIGFGVDTNNHKYLIQKRTGEGGGLLAASGVIWDVYVDGFRKNTEDIILDPAMENGYITAGGEVSEYSSVFHNEMGPATFSNLRYERNSDGNLVFWLTVTGILRRMGDEIEVSHIG